LFILDSGACPGPDPGFAGMTKDPVFRLFAGTSEVKWFHFQVILPASCHPNDTGLQQGLHGRGLEIPHPDFDQLFFHVGKLHSGISALGSQSLQVIYDAAAGSLDSPGNAVSREDKDQDQKKNSQRNLHRIGHCFTSTFFVSPRALVLVLRAFSF